MQVSPFDTCSITQGRKIFAWNWLEAALNFHNRVEVIGFGDDGAPWHTWRRTSPRSVDDVRVRKLCIANDGGSVHGIDYDLQAQFGIGLAPATV